MSSDVKFTQVFDHSVNPWIAVRRDIDREACLGIDCHHRLSLAEAVNFCSLLPPDTLGFLEELIRSETTEACASLRTMTDIPFAIGEEFSSQWEATPLLEATNSSEKTDGDTDVISVEPVSFCILRAYVSPYKHTQLVTTLDKSAAPAMSQSGHSGAVVTTQITHLHRSHQEMKT